MGALLRDYCQQFGLSPQEFINLPAATRIALLKGEPEEDGSLYGCPMSELDAQAIADAVVKKLQDGLMKMPVVLAEEMMPGSYASLTIPTRTNTALHYQLRCYVSRVGTMHMEIIDPFGQMIWEQWLQ